jgi:hypothetical protein
MGKVQIAGGHYFKNNFEIYKYSPAIAYIVGNGSTVSGERHS